LMDQKKYFQGFFPETIDFLNAISYNNNKQWFELHKNDYEQYLLEPFKFLVADLSESILKIDPLLEVRPQVNKTISRIYRDTRFSKDKRLYRDRMWLTFKRPTENWLEAPAYFFELMPDGYRFGMGFYNATKLTMDYFRQQLTEHPEEFERVITFLSDRTFRVEGELYKKNMCPDAENNLRQWYQWKTFYISCNNEIDDLLFSDELTARIILAFEKMASLYHYLMKIKEEAISNNVGR